MVIGNSGEDLKGGALLRRSPAVDVDHCSFLFWQEL
jgi:hypothetical protein